MSAEYDVFKTPHPESDPSKQQYHARLVPYGEVARINELAMLISECTSFSSGDVSGMLKALQEIMGLLLVRGRKVELEGLGLFSVTLGSRPGNQTDQDTREVYIKTVDFRCSTELKEKVRKMKLKRVHKETKIPVLSSRQRKKKILGYLKTEDSVITSDCMDLNHCTRYAAQKDLKELGHEGLIRNIRSRNTAAYVLAK